MVKFCLLRNCASFFCISSFAWLVFSSTEALEKAYEPISKAKVKGSSITVDYCGSRSKKANEVKQFNKGPINPLELYVAGFPASTSKDVIKVIFRSAKSITFPHKATNIRPTS